MIRKKAGAVAAAILLICSHKAHADADLLMSAGVKAAFREGVTLPLYVNNVDAVHDQGEGNLAVHEDRSTIIGNLYVSSDGESIFIDRIELEPIQNFQLSDSLRQELTSISHMPVNDAEYELDDGASLQFDVLKMQANLQVSQTSFVATEASSEYLGSSTSGLSGVINYSANAFQVKNEDLNGYLTMNTLSSYNEHHFMLDGSFYAAASDEDSEVELDRALYERDFHGRQLDVGWVEGWGLQSFANVSTMDNQRFFGVSYGNNSQSYVDKSSESLIPISLYFPSAGEARVFRNNRLIDIQRFSMGSHMLDTSRLPEGIYNVTVKVVTGGEIESSRQYRVNKPTQDHAPSGGLAWQIWGGYSSYDDDYSDNNFYSGDQLSFEEDREDSGSDRYDDDAILGVSLANHWHELSWSGSLYQKGKTSVLESNLSYPLLDQLSFDISTLSATDSSDQFMPSLTYQASFGSLWANASYTNEGDELILDDDASWSIGGDIDLSSWAEQLGTLSASYEEDYESGDFSGERAGKYTRIDYSQLVFSNDYSMLRLNLGINNSSYGGDEDNEKYISVTFSLPFADTVQAGLSHDSDGTDLDLEYEKLLDGTIKTVGGNVSLNMGNEDERLDNYNLYSDYQTRYVSGSVGLIGDSDTYNTSVDARGGVAWGGGHITAGNAQGDSAIVVELPADVVEQDRDMVAQINGNRYPLNKHSTLIPLTPYHVYEVQILTGDYSKSAYNVDQSLQEITLYPGNIITINPVVRRMVTVFGRLMDESGTPMASTRLHNHIGRTITDDDGYFSIDVSTLDPEVNVSLTQGPNARADVPIKSVTESAVWMGDLTCSSNAVECRWSGTSPTAMLGHSESGEHQS